MKNKLYLFVMAIMVAIVAACEKETFNDQNNDLETNALVRITVLDNIETVINPIDIKEYTKNNEDPDDQKINEQILTIAVAAKEYFRNNSFNKIIFNQAKKSANNCFDLNKLATVSTLKSTTTEYFNLISAIKNADMTHLSTNPLKSGFIEEYEPAIHIVNLETADMTKKPIICAGFEVNSELKGMEAYEDNIVGWFKDSEGKQVEILLNEEMVLKTKHPVYVIDNAEKAGFNPKNFNLPEHNFNLLKSATPRGNIYTDEFKINHRYERSGRSEFCITAVLIDEHKRAGYILDGGNNRFVKIASVRNKYIGKLLYELQLICNNDVEPTYSNYLFWNTYERDWFNSRKPLGRATKNGVTIDLWGHRRYTSEWYGIDPDALERNPLDLSTVVNYQQKSYSNSKGTLKFNLYNY